LRDLVDYVSDNDLTREWLALMDREFGHVVAMVQGIVKERKEEANAL
jgi:hypothetical protein